MGAYKMSPKLLSLYRHKHETIRDFAIALLKFVDRKDVDGRDRGLDYGTIRYLILRKFPTVLRPGPHQGHPTRMTRRELYEVARSLHLPEDRVGTRLPVRSRSKVKKDQDRLTRKRRRVYKTPRCKLEANRRYLHSAKGLAAYARYNSSPKGRERLFRYQQTPKFIEVKRRYEVSPLGREAKWRRNHG